MYVNTWVQEGVLWHLYVFEIIAPVHCVAYGLRSRSYHGSQCLDNIYLFEEGFQTTLQFLGLETGILNTSIEREQCFWSEQFACGSDQFREEGAPGNSYRNHVALSKQPEPQMWGSWFQIQTLPLTYCIFLFPNFGFLICQLELII